MEKEKKYGWGRRAIAASRTSEHIPAFCIGYRSPSKRRSPADFGAGGAVLPLVLAGGFLAQLQNGQLARRHQVGATPRGPFLNTDHGCAAVFQCTFSHTLPNKFHGVPTVSLQILHKFPTEFPQSLHRISTESLQSFQRVPRESSESLQRVSREFPQSLYTNLWQTFSNLFKKTTTPNNFTRRLHHTMLYKY